MPIPAANPATPADGPGSGDIGHISARRRGRDAQIAEFATDQGGLVTLEQLRSLGLEISAVHKRVRLGRLHPVFQTVYAVGHSRLTSDDRLRAAILACGEGAVISHRTAAALWAIRPTRGPVIDVTAPNRRGRSPNGIAAHRDGALRPADLSSERGIPCTSVARTLLDTAGIDPVSQLERSIAEAQRRRIFDLAACWDLIDRSRGRRGVARFRMLISDLDPSVGRTRSELERMFLSLCHQAGLPLPEVNFPIDLRGGTVLGDFVWPDRRWVVETDGRESHETASAFESDRLRDQRFNLAGWHVIRCTWRQVEAKSPELRHTLHTLINQPPPTGREVAI